MATDAWQAARDGVARLFGRADAQRQTAIEAQFDGNVDLVKRARDPDQVRQVQVPLWQMELARLLEEHPDAERELRALSRSRPQSLTNLGTALLGLGRPERALTATEQAVEVYRRLAQANLAVYEDGFAQSLTNLGMALLGLGRPEQALTATEQAVEVYRRLAQANPAAYEANLAQSLWGYAWVGALIPTAWGRPAPSQPPTRPRSASRVGGRIASPPPPENRACGLSPHTAQASR